MNPNETRALLVEAFLEVAPDCDPTTIAGDAPYRDVLGIDSIDFLAIIEAVASATGIEVPEADYPRIDTFDAFVAYLSSRRR